jgi:NADPH-dependent stearoyl-CoA 9-desaturase
MAISDVKEYAHLTDEQVEEIGKRLDQVRADIEASLGEKDAEYIRRLVAIHRGLAAGGRVMLFASKYPPAWIAGTLTLGLAKILENIEIGHNVMHGQWDWMNDPEIHSSTWEWDTVCPAEAWKHLHNYEHHTFTNVLGKDRDVGYGILRVTRDQPWNVANLGNPIYNFALALLFEWGVGVHDLDIERIRKGKKDWKVLKQQMKLLSKKVRRQVGKDYIIFPALTGPFFFHTLAANAVANLIRNVWAYAVIFVNHFPDGVEHFSVEELENETPHEWYLRQMLASANFTGPKVVHLLSGYLSHQIEHHLFPDLPSIRYPEIAKTVRPMCEEFGLPYNSASWWTQYGQVLRTIAKLALPDRKSGGDDPDDGARLRSVETTDAPEAPQTAAADGSVPPEANVA